MKIKFTKEEIEILEFCNQTCGCESYYSFQCLKCFATGQGFVVDRADTVETLKKAGLIERHSYNGLILSKAGKAAARSAGLRVY